MNVNEWWQTLLPYLLQCTVCPELLNSSESSKNLLFAEVLTASLFSDARESGPGMRQQILTEYKTGLDFLRTAFKQPIDAL